nr:ETEC_3214 domain-containing protein [uncultured Methylophaga sp.]
MSVTIKAAKISAVATILAAIIASATVFITEEKTETDRSIDNSNSTQNPVIQNSQNVSVTYSFESKENSIKLKPENSLGKVFIGANERFIESIFGIPVVTNQISSINSKETFYSFERFYLQFLYDNEGTLFFYSLTSKDVNFNPEIPKLGALLGQSTFSEISQEATHLYSYLSSKHYGYGEYVYLGNPGNYHNYYLAYNSAGVNYGNWNNVVTYVDGYEGQDLGRFRSIMKPNSYGVGDMKGVTNDSLNYEVGVEFYTFRNEP